METPSQYRPEDTAASVTGPMTPQWYRVASVRRETRTVRAIELMPTDDSRGVLFEPGQFTMLYAFGIGEVPISISGDPTMRGPLVHTIASVGEVSQALCKLSIGDMVGVRGPFGSSWPVEAADSVL